MEPEPPEVAQARQDPRRHVGPYLVLRELGRGGMGVVVEAWDPRVGRRVALKRLLEQAGERARARFEREARLGAGLEHPGIARTLDAAFDGPGAPYLVQELVRGKPLEKLVDEDEPAPVRRAVELVAAAARALEHAHSRGVVHRDVKPQNIMVRDDGSVCVLDLGLARGPAQGSVDVTATNQILGTPAYLAPEQITDARHAGPAADVYGLGGTLYALLVGKPPFLGPSAAILAMVRSTPPDPPSAARPGLDRSLDAPLDAPLDAIVLRCLEKDPAKRYPSAAALADALDGWLAAPAPVAAAPAAPGAARTVLVAAGGMVVGGLLATGLFLALRPRAAAPVATRPVELVEEPDEPEPPTEQPPATEPATERPPVTEPPATEPPATEPPAEVRFELPTPTTELPALPKLSAAKKAEIKRLLADAGALGKNKDYEGAEALCAQALAVGLTVQALADRGYWRFCRKDHEGAAADFAEAARLDPEVALHHANLASNLTKIGRLDEAAAAYERAIALDPREATNYNALADIRVRQGDKVAARAELERGVRAVPDLPELWSQCGYASFRLRDYARAAECYAKGTELNPKSDRMWANLSYNRALAGDVKGALEAAERALSLDRQDPFNWKKRAYCHFLANDLEGAIADYEQALVLDPTDEDVRENLVFCREQLEKRRAEGEQ